MGVIKAFSVSGLVPSQINPQGTTVVYFPDLPGANLWNVGASGINAGVSSQFKGLQPSSTNNAGGMQVPGNSVLDGQRFDVLLSGDVLFGAGEASTTAKVGLYLSNVAPGVSPAYSTIYEMTLTNQAADAVYYPFTMAVNMEGDTDSGILQLNVGAFSQINGGAGGGTVGPKSALTGISFAVDPAFTLVVGVTFGAANAGNISRLKQFQVALA